MGSRGSLLWSLEWRQWSGRGILKRFLKATKGMGTGAQCRVRWSQITVPHRHY